jgi:hypothetical protein
MTKLTTTRAIKLMVAAALATSMLSGCIVAPPAPPHGRDHGGDYRDDHRDHDDRGR